MTPKSPVEELPNLTPSQMAPIAFGLTFLGGYIDSYAYINFNHTLPIAQTGNMVLLTSDLVNGDTLGISTKLTTLTCFILGFISSRYIYRHHKSPYWRIYAFLVTAMAMLLTYLAEGKLLSLLALAPLSFSLAFITGTFTKVDQGFYNNAFTTGNMKKAIIAWSEYVFERKAADKHKATLYTGLVASFIGGASLSAVCQKYLGRGALLVSASIILYLMCYYLYMFKKEKGQKVLTNDDD